METSGKKLGKLALDIVENFVESKLGEKFIKDLRAPTQRQIAITEAMTATSNRLAEEWQDPHLWNAIFNHRPEKKELLHALREAVITYYGHPSDTGFARVLAEIIHAYPEFSDERVQKAVERFLEVLSEELALADDGFREKYTDLVIIRNLGESKPGLPEAVRPASAPPRPSLMIGRDADIRALKERLGAAESGRMPVQVLTAIKGWPGVGKTTIASALAHEPEIAHRYPDGVLWTSLGQEPSILSVMAIWGRALGTDEIRKARSVDEAKSMLAGLLRHKRMLLIIDDVWKAEDGVPFLVGGAGCATLITTRLNEVAGALAPAAGNIYTLKVLNDSDSIDLLRELAPSVVRAHPEECLVLVQELEGLPLALQVAGRMLNTEASYGFGVIELIAELREGARLLTATAPADRADLVTQTTPTIAALLQKSLDRLDEYTKECYAYLGAFAPKPATFEINAMQYVWQVEDPRPVIKTLVNRGLLEFMPDLGRFQMHALLVMLARTLLVEAEE